jgi:hypothetical protein
MEDKTQKIKPDVSQQKVFFGWRKRKFLNLCTAFHLKNKSTA